MAKFVYVYSGGEGATTPEAQEASMQAWQSWFATFGDDLVEIGAPFGAASTVSATGTSESGSSGLGGYSVVSADSLSAAADRAAGCPIISDGGVVEVYATIEM